MTRSDVAHDVVPGGRDELLGVDRFVDVSNASRCRVELDCHDVSKGHHEHVLGGVAREPDRCFCHVEQLRVIGVELAHQHGEGRHAPIKHFHRGCGPFPGQALDGGADDAVPGGPRIEHGHVSELEIDAHTLGRFGDRGVPDTGPTAETPSHLDEALQLEDPERLSNDSPGRSEAVDQLALDRQGVTRLELAAHDELPDVCGDRMGRLHRSATLADRKIACYFLRHHRRDWRSAPVTQTSADIYYDPYDLEIDVDPYPLWKRLRDEAPLYYNERYDFHAVSRFDDVEKCLVDWRTYISGKGSVLEMIKANIEIPPGSILFEDPPTHDVHRSLLSRVFTPRRMAAIEPKVREFCARSLDPLVGSGGFDFIADLGAQMPMRTIGMLLGIPEEDQERIRDRLDQGLRLTEGVMPDRDYDREYGSQDFADYLDWRAEHPSDDLMTELLQAEFEDFDGTVRTLTRVEILNYIGLLAGAGNETTTRLIGWTGKVLAEHPDQRQELVDDPSLIPNAIEELLRYEAPSPVQSRYVTRDVEHYGKTVKEGSIMVLLNAAANRDERAFPDPDRFDIHRKMAHHLTFGYGIHFCLGSHLARLEGRVALDEVLKRFPRWEVDWDNAEQAHTSTVRGWERLPVTIG